MCFPLLLYIKGMAKPTQLGLYVVGRLMAVEELTAKSGRVYKRLLVYFGDAKNLAVLAPHDANLPPEGASVTFPLRSLTVNDRGELTASLRVDADSNPSGGASS
jgi:hypothetical protein